MGKLSMARLLALLLSVGLLLAMPATAADSRPRVHLETDLGDITLELFPDKAPVTVANFLQYCRDGFYLGTIFHRVVPGFVVQGGGYTFDYVKKETRDPIANESDNGLFNRSGTLAMARLADPDSATSQFYINLRNNRHLDPKPNQAGYTVFGRVIDGMKVLTKITREPQGRYREQAPDLPVRILTVHIEEPPAHSPGTRN